MPEAAYSSIMTEAVAVFHDVESFQAAIDDLLPAGFDHADIASARASSISLIENTLSISFVGPRRSQRSMRVIFEPSRLKLYMSPFGSMIKAMIGLVRLLVSIEPSAPIVTTTIEPSTPTFQP